MQASKQKTLLFSSVFAYLLLLFLQFFSIFLFGIGQIFVALLVSFVNVWLLYSPSSGFPPDEVLADGETFPVLNELVRAVSAEVDVPPPAIMLTKRNSCTLGLIGFRQRPVLIIGQSLLLARPFDEKLVLLAHEIGHLRDGTFSRSTFHITARGIIYRVWWLAKTARLRPIANLFGKWRQLNSEIQMWDGIQSEYVADYWSAQIAGSTATYRILAHVENVWKTSNQAHPLSHPTFEARLRAIDNLPYLEPRIVFTSEREAALTAELKSWPYIMQKREEAMFESIGVPYQPTTVVRS